MRGPAMAAAALALAAALAPAAHAHTTVEVGQYEIEAGWGIEPPVVGIRNSFVFEVSVPGEVEGVKTGVAGAFRAMDATARFGGIEKRLDVSSAATPGHYFSDVIPTRTGSMSVHVGGQIDGTPVDVEIPVEDVETTAVLDFPPRAASGGGDEAALRDALSALQRDVGALKAGGAPAAGPAAGPAYDLAVFGMSLGAAGVILAVLAMVKRR